ncbi:MAG: hypothetical protein ABSF61_05740 [Anaerolineales bacterium]
MHLRHPGMTRSLALALVLALALLSCSLPFSQPQASPTPAPTDTPIPQALATDAPTAAVAPVTHVRHPGNPGTSAQYLTDTASIGTSGDHRAPGGEDYNLDRYERPFTSQDMTYLPALDITRADIAWDGQWFYITIKLQASPLTAQDRPADYGAEIDVNHDGRGDYLILISAPKTKDWTTDGVRVFQDQNHDVGGATPLASDNQPGNGYETLVFNQGQGPDPDAAWGRISPSDPATVQIAFLRNTIGGAGSFLWWAWADAGIRRPDWFDYNDHFTLAEAGSPLAESKPDYPLKGLWGIDDTCRMAYGFTPDASVKGLCGQFALPTSVPFNPNGHG